MPAKPNIGDDLRYADGIESVLFWFASTAESRRLATVLRSPVSVREAAASGGVYTTQDTRFAMLRSEFLEGALPEVGGLIEVESEIWAVYGLDVIVHAAQYRAWCKRELIRGQLPATLRIQKPAYARDADLVLKPNWTDVISGAAGRVQEVLQELVVEHERRRTKVTHRVYAEVEEGVVQAGWRILCDGNTYNILRISGRGVLGTLEVFDVELARQPQAR